jgi:serine/threonine-protein kinase HipA
MNKILDVYLNQNLVGNFIQDIHGKNSFTYSRDYLQMPQAMAISTSLPLQEKPFDNNATHAFFTGLLPEESQRKIIARILGISANNDFSLKLFTFV